VLAAQLRRGLARKDPDALQLLDDLPDTAPRSAMLRATTEAVTVLDEVLRPAEPDGIALLCDRAGQLPATEPSSREVTRQRGCVGSVVWHDRRASHDGHRASSYLEDDRDTDRDDGVPNRVGRPNVDIHEG
jgi:hypothetical protein